MILQKIIRIIKECFLESYSTIRILDNATLKIALDSYLYIYKKDLNRIIHKYKRDKTIETISFNFSNYPIGGYLIFINIDNDNFIITQALKSRNGFRSKVDYLPLERVDNLICLLFTLNLMKKLKGKKGYNRDIFINTLYLIDKRFVRFNLEDFTC